MAHVHDTLHLLNRAGFGPQLINWPDWAELPPQAAWKRLQRASSEVAPLFTYLDFDRSQRLQDLPADERREMRQAQRKTLQEHNLAWLQRMVQGPGALREKMTLFWHDHFACRLSHPALAARQHETLRRHALGKFGDLLLAIARDPGMLQFLNNQQNRKEHPNENFARELLELFTLGRGHYTEQDIQEAARAFTGWGFNQEGFVFRQRRHDTGQKTFFDQIGPWQGEDIIRMILAHPRTAIHLVEKLYRFFVHPEIDDRQVAQWADYFRAQDYDISALLDRIFTSDHFYAQRNRGVLVKSPVLYLVSLIRRLDLHISDDKQYLRTQRLLGQVLFQPPNVAGWPEHLAWIDGSSLLTRMQLPRMIMFQGEWAVAPKPSFAGNEDAFARAAQATKGKFTADIDWEGLMRQFPPDKMEALQDYLLSIPRPLLTEAQLSRMAPDQTPLGRLKATCMGLICSPEFQLC